LTADNIELTFLRNQTEDLLHHKGARATPGASGGNVKQGRTLNENATQNRRDVGNPRRVAGVLNNGVRLRQAHGYQPSHRRLFGVVDVF